MGMFGFYDDDVQYEPSYEDQLRDCYRFADEVHDIAIEANRRSDDALEAFRRDKPTIGVRVRLEIMAPETTGWGWKTHWLKISAPAETDKTLQRCTLYAWQEMTYPETPGASRVIRVTGKVALVQEDLGKVSYWRRESRREAAERVMVETARLLSDVGEWSAGYWYAKRKRIAEKWEDLPRRIVLNPPPRIGVWFGDKHYGPHLAPTGFSQINGYSYK